VVHHALETATRNCEEGFIACPQAPNPELLYQVMLPLIGLPIGALADAPGTMMTAAVRAPKRTSSENIRSLRNRKVTFPGAGPREADALLPRSRLPSRSLPSVPKRRSY